MQVSSNTLAQPGFQAQPASSFSDRLRHSKALIPTMAVMGVTVLALAAALVVQRSDARGDASKASTPAPVAALAAATSSTALTSPTPQLPDEKAAPEPAVVAKPVHKPVAHKQPAPASQAPAQAQPQPTPVVVAQVPVCANCGIVESVTPVERKGQASGVGAVAGGVVGGVLGNQVGQGSGSTVATVLGAIGGGYAGNAIEKNVKKTTVYQVRVRMEDGSRRTIEQSQPIAAGSKVTVDGGRLRVSS